MLGVCAGRATSQTTSLAKGRLTVSKRPAPTTEPAAERVVRPERLPGIWPKPVRSKNADRCRQGLCEGDPNIPHGAHGRPGVPVLHLQHHS
jgi:hypothetical protein